MLNEREKEGILFIINKEIIFSSLFFLLKKHQHLFYLRWKKWAVSKTFEGKGHLWRIVLQKNDYGQVGGKWPCTHSNTVCEIQMR